MHLSARFEGKTAFAGYRSAGAVASAAEYDEQTYEADRAQKTLGLLTAHCGNIAKVMDVERLSK